MRSIPWLHLLILVAALPACTTPTRGPAEGAKPPGPFHDEAQRLRPFLRSELASAFIAGASRLPLAPERTIYRTPDRRYLSKSAAAALAEDERGALEALTIDGTRYYTTKYGTPLAYSRVLEIAATQGFDDATGKRVLDFGYGTVGHLRLLAGLGAHAVGVDVDSFLTALYSEPEDQGAVVAADGTAGSVTLVDGQWPARADVVAAVGGGYDLFTSKNTLKRGYIHPAQEVDPRFLVHLGVDDATFLEALHRILNPGGLVVIYNISPAQNPERYIPWADGRCPFAPESIEAAGFTVLAYDTVDDEATREMAYLLGWDQGPNGMDLETGLFGHYTVFSKPRR